MRWTKIRSDDPFNKKVWYKSSYIVTKVNLQQFGQVWGKDTVGFRLSFSIHSRQGTCDHSKQFPFQLLINDNQPINGHVYIKTVKQGKQIAEQVAECIKKSWRNTLNPWKGRK
jgi:hypothetical protein